MHLFFKYIIDKNDYNSIIDEPKLLRQLSNYASHCKNVFMAAQLFSSLVIAARPSTIFTLFQLSNMRTPSSVITLRYTYPLEMPITLHCIYFLQRIITPGLTYFLKMSHQIPKKRFGDGILLRS